MIKEVKVVFSADGMLRMKPTKWLRVGQVKGKKEHFRKKEHY
jgi:hypothetical protein